MNRTQPLKCKKDGTGFEPIFEFVLPDRTMRKVTYAEYLEDPYLRSLIADGRQGGDHKLFSYTYGRTLIFLDKEAHKANDESCRDSVDMIRSEVEAFPIGFFAPSGQRPLDFLNDHTADICILRGGNQRGKTATGIAKDVLDLIPCNPEWPIFTKYGVKYREWTGPKKMMFGIYKMGTLEQKIWPEIIKWIPDVYLGAYSPKWRKKGKKKVTWNRNPALPLTCGGSIRFLAYEQDDDVFASDTFDFAHWDEQPKLAQFHEVNERVSYKPGHRITMTPHKIKGNPHTGAGTWVHEAELGWGLESLAIC